jgi:CBS domain-containing protein
MQIRHILKRNPTFNVQADCLVAECIKTMANEDVGSVVVLDGARLVGLLTFRDVMRLLAQRQERPLAGHRPLVSELRVRDVMAPDPATVTLDTELHSARALMVQHRQRYVPVLDGRVLAGVVSLHDVARALQEEQVLENRMLKAYIHNWPQAAAG